MRWRWHIMIGSLLPSADPKSSLPSTISNQRPVVLSIKLRIHEIDPVAVRVVTNVRSIHDPSIRKLCNPRVRTARAARADPLADPVASPTSPPKGSPDPRGPDKGREVNDLWMPIGAMTADSTEGDEAPRATKHGLFHELLKQNAIEIVMDTVIWRVYDETASSHTTIIFILFIIT